VVFVVVVFLKPQPKGFIEFFQCHSLLYAGEEASPGRAEESFDFSTGRAVVRPGVDEGDLSQGTASGQHIRGKSGAVIHIESFRQSIAEESLLEDLG
jgi:hypothetical protein